MNGDCLIVESILSAGLQEASHQWSLARGARFAASRRAVSGGKIIGLTWPISQIPCKKRKNLSW